MKETSTLYNGDVVIDFDAEAKRNRYTIFDGGAKVKPTPPSVTTITDLRDKSAPLMAWAVNCALDICAERVQPDQIHGADFLAEVWADAKKNFRDVRKKAADTGSQAHYYLDRYVRQEPDFAPPLAGTPVRACFDSALDWFSKHDIVSVCSERRVYSRSHLYCGTLDHLSKIDGVLSLMDYKAAKHIYPVYVFQISAYIRAYEEEHPDQHIEQAVILQLGEEAAPYTYTRQQIDTAFEAFLGLRAVHKCERLIGKIKPDEKAWIDTL